MTEILNSTLYIGPEIVLVLGILLSVLLAAFGREKSRLVYYTFLGVVLCYMFAIVVKYDNVTTEGVSLFEGLLHLDKLSLLVKQLSAISAFIFLVHARFFRYAYDNEVYIMVLFVLLGISVLSMSTHFLTLFVSLEIVSLSSYVLVSAKKEKRNFEAGIKYLIFGATASAIMLFGVSLFFGMSHSLDFASEGFSQMVAKSPPFAVKIVTLMVLSGFLFKITAAPFHQWVPDVYQSTSTPVLSFLSFAPKAAGFLVVARIVHAGFVDLNMILVAIVCISLVVGNLSALWQNDFKRLLGYSAIVHSGFILIGLVKGPETDYYGTFFYLASYLPMTMGAFFLADLIHMKINTYDIPSMAGLGKKYGLLAFNALIILIALIGLPPTVGFMAKMVVFTTLYEVGSSAVNGGVYYFLLVFGLLNSAIALYYYLRPAYYMLVVKPIEGDSSYVNSFWMSVLLCYFSAFIIAFFVSPNLLSEWIKNVLF